MDSDYKIILKSAYEVLTECPYILTTEYLSSVLIARECLSEYNNIIQELNNYKSCIDKLLEDRDILTEPDICFEKQRLAYDQCIRLIEDRIKKAIDRVI